MAVEDLLGHVPRVSLGNEVKDPKRERVLLRKEKKNGLSQLWVNGGKNKRKGVRQVQRNVLSYNMTITA